MSDDVRRYSIRYRIVAVLMYSYSSGPDYYKIRLVDRTYEYMY